MAEIERLTNTQKVAVSGVLEALDSTPVKAVIFLEGISGSGKKAVLDDVAHQVADKKGITVDKSLARSLSYRNPSAKDNIKYGSHNVTSGTPRTFENFERDLARQETKSNLVAVTLQGMTLPESLAYIKAIKRDKPTTLTDDELATASFGIYHIAQMLTFDPELPGDVAIRVAGAHLGDDLSRSERYCNHLREGFNRFLQIAPPKEVVNVAREQSGGWDTGNLYNQLGRVLKAGFDLREEGIHEESPLFVASGSLDIYNDYLAKVQS